VRLAWQAEGVNKSVTVDLIGVNPTDHDRWANQPMQGYADSQLRKDSVASIRSYRFSPSDTETKTLDSDDEIWDRWHARGATELFVLADIPGVRDEGSPTGSGATRLILPLDTSCWKIGTIRLLLRPGSIVAETPPDPDCAK